jgi:hypothetical protein
MPAAARNARVVTVHAVNALARLRKHELVDAVLAHLALEAVGMVRVVPGHDRFVEDGEVADVARVRAVGADRRAVREQEEVRVRGDLLMAFCAFEAVDMKERLSVCSNMSSLSHDGCVWMQRGLDAVARAIGMRKLGKPLTQMPPPRHLNHPPPTACIPGRGCSRP